MKRKYRSIGATGNEVPMVDIRMRRAEDMRFTVANDTIDGEYL